MRLVDKSRYEKKNKTPLIPNHLKEKILTDTSFNTDSIWSLS